jgi:UDP-N-acetylmuramyl pentapeptide phosphotransferase/UDP-N-acetylglucosamine-1-phosphate transferase
VATDVPNDRSLHSAPTPRIGGWGVIPAALATALVFNSADWMLAGLCTLLFVVSYLDDRSGLPVYVRLLVHVAVAAGWLAFGPISLPLYLAAMAVFAIVWITNLFNFMDGADGLAGGMAVIGFSAFAIVAAGAGVLPLAVCCVAIVGASAGFLIFNFPPARVFLGDAGSVTIGFVAGAFGIWGWAAGAWPAWFPFLVAAPFFLDATITILRRMLRAEKFWRPHREHYYQRAIRSGWTHTQTALAEYVLMSISAGLAVAMLRWSPVAQYVCWIAVGISYAGIAFAIDRRWAALERAREHVGLRQHV